MRYCLKYKIPAEKAVLPSLRVFLSGHPLYAVLPKNYGHSVIQAGKKISVQIILRTVLIFALLHVFSAAYF